MTSLSKPAAHKSAALVAAFGEDDEGKIAACPHRADRQSSTWRHGRSFAFLATVKASGNSDYFGDLFNEFES